MFFIYPQLSTLGKLFSFQKEILFILSILIILLKSVAFRRQPPPAFPMEPLHQRHVCQRCGACCRRPGFVRIADAELPRLATHLGMSETAFIERFTRLTPRRNGLALIDKPDGSCHFLEGNDCRLQAVKPAQCVGFPETWRRDGWEALCQAARAAQ